MIAGIGHSLLHYTGGDDGNSPWYLEPSGFVSLVFTLVPLWVGVIVFLRHHNCHVDGCRSVRTSLDPAVHAPACRTHHSHGKLHGRAPMSRRI